MDAYALLTEDARYGVPTITVVTARSEAHVRELALARLRETPNHLSVEVSFEDIVLFKVTRSEDRASARPFKSGDTASRNCNVGTGRQDVRPRALTADGDADSRQRAAHERRR